MRVALVVAVLAAACSSSSSESRPAPTQRSGPDAPAAQATVVGSTQPGTLVALEPASTHEFPLPEGEAFMDQSAQTFVPDFVVARTGQRMQFRSSEDIIHNVRVVNSETKETEFNVVTPPWGSHPHTFKRPGFYDVTCDIHSTMRASILVTSSPYTALADDEGKFSLEQVRPGPYKLIGFLEGKRVEKDVTVAAPRTEVRVQ